MEVRLLKFCPPPIRCGAPIGTNNMARSMGRGWVRSLRICQGVSTPPRAPTHKYTTPRADPIRLARWHQHLGNRLANMWDISVTLDVRAYYSFISEFPARLPWPKVNPVRLLNPSPRRLMYCRSSISDVTACDGSSKLSRVIAGSDCAEIWAAPSTISAMASKAWAIRIQSCKEK